MIKINFVASYSEAYDLTDPKQAKKIQRMKNAKKRPSNGTIKTTKFGYKNFDFLTRWK